MKNYLSLLFLLMLFASCNDKVVHLPETTNKDVTEIHDVSSIYMFYDEEKDSVDFNRRNMIGSTNWLVAIDKRLTLNQISPHLKYLFEKRHAEGLHTKEGLKSFFSCNNTNIKDLSFIEFTDVNYKTDSITEFMTELFVNPSKTKQEYYINFVASDSILIGNQMEIKNFKKGNFIEAIEQNAKNDSLKSKLHLTFRDNLKFQDYISFKTELLKLNSEEIEISNDEYIYEHK